MCRPLGVTRGGYYRHLSKAVDYYHLELIEAVQDLAKASDNTYLYNIQKFIESDAVYSFSSKGFAKNIVKELLEF